MRGTVIAVVTDYCWSGLIQLIVRRPLHRPPHNIRLRHRVRHHRRPDLMVDGDRFDCEGVFVADEPSLERLPSWIRQNRIPHRHHHRCPAGPSAVHHRPILPVLPEHHGDRNWLDEYFACCCCGFG